jgi:arylformamidase
MKVYDISQEVFSCKVYPGDPNPERIVMKSFEKGDGYHLTAFSMCAHNGTHVDAPIHFLADGKTVDQIPLEQFVGQCLVIYHQGDVTGEDAAKMVEKLQGIPRLLISGTATVTKAAAHIFADAKLLLVGNESQSVGPEDAPSAVHKILLGNGVVLLEGIVLTNIPEGKYLLCAAPLNLADSDGAPCRAILIEP